MVDTNILISMLLFPSKNYDDLLEIINRGHKLVLSSFVVDEFWDVIKRKFPQKKDAADTFLTKLTYELAYTPHKMQSNLFEIRDMKDYPVVYSAIIDDTDVLISGDKDIKAVEIEKPEIMTMTEFMDKYGY